MSTFDLFSSVRDGNTEIVRRLLQSKSCRARLNDRNEWGDTALHLAAEVGNGEICQMLTAAGASVTVRNNRGETCLHRAAVGGHVEAVRAIVGRDQDPDAVNSQNDAGYTALHHAAKHGSKELIDILVKAGADQMIENNAGETPYMVAHKYQQWDAERLLLNVEQQHADKAIREMNRKEKDIIRGYLNAVKLASQLESRVRIMLVGDKGSGKTSLKKTLSGESYEAGEKGSSGINADPSVTRVTFKQFKEWVQQPTSKADTHRLNLEYIDVVIDYILNFVRQPQIVSDDRLDPNALQIEKEQVKNVHFNPEEDVIPLSDKDILAMAAALEESAESEASGGGGGDGEPGNASKENPALPPQVKEPASQITTDVEVHAPLMEGVIVSSTEAPQGVREEGEEEGDLPGRAPRNDGQRISSSEEEEFVKAPSKRLSVTFATITTGSATPFTNPITPIANPPDLSDSITTNSDLAIADEPDSSISYLDKEEGEYFIRAVSDEDDNFNSDDRLHRLGMESKSMSYSDPNSMGVLGLDHGSLASLEGPPGMVKNDSRQPRSQPGTAPPTSTDKDQESQVSNEELDSLSSEKKMGCTSLIFNQTQRELSRLLIEKLPMEILKRMVIRWPVGNEHYQDRSSLDSNRLAMMIWDVSGDPIQGNFIPFFFSSRCLFVMTYNLTKDLEQPCLSYRKKNLANVDGSIPTNAQVLESWLGCATAFTKNTPSEPFKCTEKTPLLPPVIIACTHSDHPSLEDSPVLFHQFFSRKSFKSYNKHLVEASNPSALRLSSRYETLSTKSEVELEVPYSGHHLLRREIEHMARQLPFIRDAIPVQWIKFEQLVYGLQQQRKLILLYEDLARYIAEHCHLSGPLQVIPVLAHFHDIGAIIHFYRHPEMSGIVITRPQWLINALSSIITSNPTRWVTQEVQEGYKKLSQVGYIAKENLLIIYRCARMGQKHWNEMLFILNCMDLITCHPSLHESKSVYLPCMVVESSPDPHLIPSEGDPCPIYFRTLEDASFPIALFNQLVVRCIRSSQYMPKLYYKLAHFQLNETHHLVIWMEHKAVVCLVQEHTDKFCAHCMNESQARFSFEPKCSTIEHLIGEDCELMPTDNISTLIHNSTNSGVNVDLHLSFPDDSITMEKLCPVVLKFVSENLQFLCNCWFPGLDMKQTSSFHDEEVVLDQLWKHNVLYRGKADPKLAIWFSK